MKTYFADTNLFLRFILKDNLHQAETAAKFINKAKNKEIRLVVLPEIIEEMEFVLRRIYWPKDHARISAHLQSIINTSYFDVRQREIMSEAVKLYEIKNIDIVDAILFISARREFAEILSFDEDFKKLK